MKCRCCGSENLESVLDLGRQPWGNDYARFGDSQRGQEYSLCFYVCNDCMMAQIDSTIPKEIMFVNHTYMSGTTKSLKQHFVQVGRAIAGKTQFGESDYILDIGGNDGTFLEYFKENGIGTLNIDSGRLQAEISNARGIPCINKFFNRITAREIIDEHGKAAVIHGSGILFHLEELHDAFWGIKELLADDGMLVAEFIYLPDMMKHCAYDQIYHEHLVYYSLHSFQYLLEQFDLEIYDAELKAVHGGSCIAYITHKGAKTQTARLANLKNQEIEDGIETMQTYHEFGDRVKKHKVNFLKVIGKLRADGKRIQALGAPVKGSTIINYCKLTTEEIECGVEINPHKFDTYFPGTKIPVYDQDKTPEPDVYLLLAWNFKDEILPKLQSFRDKGGQILIPIPCSELI